MTDDQKYNGWTNYETWNVNLWLSNNEGSYNYWREVAAKCRKEAEPEEHLTTEEKAAIDFANQLKSEIEEGNPLADQSNLYSDILTTALSSANYDEIARHWIDNVEE